MSQPTTNLTKHEIRLLLKQLDSRNDGAREDAWKILERMDDDDAQAVGRMLVGPFRHYRWAQFFLAPSIAVVIATILATIIYWVPSQSHGLPITFRIVLPLFIVCVIAMVIMTLQRSRWSATLLSKTNDVRMLGPLCLVAADGSMPYSVMSRALVRLLPKVRHESGVAILPRDMAKLLRLLGDVKGPSEILYDEDLAIEVLAVIADQGGSEALAEVQRLAAYKGEWRVAEAARQCLPVLLERVESARQREMLLRAATAPLEQLVRPASGAGVAEPELLLRPTAGHEE